MDQRWAQIRELFRAALDLEEKQREAFLLEQCPDDPDMRERVASMLKAYEEDDTFLQSPVANAGEHFASKKGHEALVGTKVGSYLIRRVIAQGGMGVVFEAFDTKLEKIFALKMMKPALMQDETFKFRFEQEAKTLARLEDPHFVRVNALIEENHNTFIVMEYIHGITLAEHIRGKGKLPPREVAGIGIQLLTALSKAHKQNIIHRDLKPSNIMLSRTDDGKPLVKVLDFGIAKNIQEAGGHTRTTGTVGTLFYMSPEQIRALRNIDHRTDLYSAAVTLYEALHGSLPFDITKDEFTIRKQIVEGRLRAASNPKYAPKTPLEHVLAKALNIDPAQRFQSADEMRAALRAAIQEQRPQAKHAPPAPPAPPLAKPRRRMARLILPVVIILVLLPLLLYALPRLQPSQEEANQTLAENNSTEQALSTDSTVSSNPESTSTLPLIDEQQATEETSQTPEAEPNIEEEPIIKVLDASPELISQIESSTPNTSDVRDPANRDLANRDLANRDPANRDLANRDLANRDLTNPESSDALNPTDATSPPPDSSDKIEEERQIEQPLATGTITLFTRPASNVYINDEYIGEVIVDPFTLPAGQHRFVIQNEEYGTWECTLPLEANQTTEKRVLFNNTITIPVVAALQDTDTLISGATIILDGVPTGAQTPTAIKLSPGLHSIRVQKEGYRLEDVVIEGAEGCFQKIGSRLNFDSNINYNDNKRVVVILSQTN